MYDIILKFQSSPKSSPKSMVNTDKKENDSKFEDRIKAFKRNAGYHHQKQLLDKDDGLKTKKQRHKQKQIKWVTKHSIIYNIHNIHNIQVVTFK